MEMMTMMMQMEKQPEFSGAYNTTPLLAEIEFSGGTSTSVETTTPPIFRSPHAVSTPPSSSIPFVGNSTAPVQEPLSMAALAPNLVATKFRGSELSQNPNSMEAMREMIFRIAVMQPIHIDPEAVKPPKRRNVRISKDPQSVAARHRRERISERIRILQRLVPGGTKMDTASMLDEAIHYVKFLKRQVQSLERVAATRPMAGSFGFPTTPATVDFSTMLKACPPSQMPGSLPMLS